jgi:hypothetical protein
MKKYVYFIFFFFAAAVLLGGCSGMQKDDESIDSHRIIPFSLTNPHTASNLFLAHEAEIYPRLKNFLELRGGPKYMKRASEKSYLLFYPEDKEYFEVHSAFEDNTVTKKEYNDIEKNNSNLTLNNPGELFNIYGPFRLDRYTFLKIKNIHGTKEFLAKRDFEPIFIINGSPIRFKEHYLKQQQDLASRRTQQRIVATPKPKPAPKKAQNKTIIVKATSSPTPFVPLNSDQQAINISQGFAERAQDGDVIHTVEIEGETLTALAEWYTGSKEKETIISQLNGIFPGTVIKKGTRITIPLGIVKNFKAKKN